jgi:23S rRNA (uracil1939-C5)-methyltransferase
MPQVTFAKIVSEGKALGYYDGRACFCVGPIPGETAEVEITRTKPRFCEAVLREITQPAPEREPAVEEHFLACSPWQGVSYDRQLELKRQMLTEALGRPELGLPVLGMTGSPEQWGYRNKLEFALDWRDGQARLAWHGRGTHELVPTPDGCRLGSEAMNLAAREVAGRLSLLGANEATSIVVRQSQAGVVVMVGLERSRRRNWSELVGPELAGLAVAVTAPGHQYDPIWHSGALEGWEELGGVRVAYPPDGFFQVNVPAFRLALADILAAVPEGAAVVDLYGGAGSVGLPLARQAKSVRGIEIDAAAVARAEASAAAADLSNYEAVTLPAQRLTSDDLQGADVVVVDPPRAGLDERVIDRLLESLPERIVYLSCNPVTQARDLMRLASAYRSEGVRGYDFYPGTLHLESLAVLDRLPASTSAAATRAAAAKPAKAASPAAKTAASATPEAAAGRPKTGVETLPAPSLVVAREDVVQQ